MRPTVRLAALALGFVQVIGCGEHAGDLPDGGGDADLATTDGSTQPCGSPSACAAAGETRTAMRLTTALNSPTDLAAFMKAMPKGGDLHNHLSGAVYAETYLAWGLTDGDCITTTTHAAVYSSSCSASTQPVPTMGAFYDETIRAWSMQDFVAGAESGHNHFFDTFGKFGAIAGAHRDDSIADLAKRAADENQLYIETMFNLGKNMGALSASTWSGTVTTDKIAAMYDALLAAPGFAGAIDNDVNVVLQAQAGYRNVLGCTGASPPAACDVGVRFIAQISRTGGNDTIFGQLVSAYEMAAKTGQIVGANLSSAEDEVASLKNYDLHMAMIGFLHDKYTTTQKSPLHVTLHAGELVPKYLPATYADANTFHVRHAVETAHAERIGHGVDILSETDSDGLLNEMHDKNIAVEVCLSSNDQILEVSGAAHPLAAYLSHGVPVALATDDQGVSRSSLAGEFVRAARDHALGYRQLKTISRDSLEHSFLPGASLWTSVTDAKPVVDCAATDTMAVGDMPNASCAAFLATSERARIQWELEQRFLLFEAAPL